MKIQKGVGSWVSILWHSALGWLSCQLDAWVASYPQRNTLVLVSVRGFVDRRYSSLKNFQGPYRESNLEPPLVLCSVFPHGRKKTAKRFTPVKNILACAGQEQWVQRPLQQSPSTATSVGRLDSIGNKHWLAPYNRQLQCHACSARGVMCKEIVKCPTCGVKLCVTCKLLWGVSHQGTALKLLQVQPPRAELKPQTTNESERNRKFRNF